VEGRRGGRSGQGRRRRRRRGRRRRRKGRDDDSDAEKREQPVFCSHPRRRPQALLQRRLLPGPLGPRHGASADALHQRLRRLVEKAPRPRTRREDQLDVQHRLPRVRRAAGDAGVRGGGRAGGRGAGGGPGGASRGVTGEKAFCFFSGVYKVNGSREKKLTFLHLVPQKKTFQNKINSSETATRRPTGP